MLFVAWPVEPLRPLSESSVFFARFGESVRALWVALLFGLAGVYSGVVGASISRHVAAGTDGSAAFMDELYEVVLLPVTVVAMLALWFFPAKIMVDLWRIGDDRRRGAAHAAANTIVGVVRPVLTGTSGAPGDSSAAVTVTQELLVTLTGRTATIVFVLFGPAAVAVTASYAGNLAGF